MTTEPKKSVLEHGFSAILWQNSSFASKFGLIRINSKFPKKFPKLLNFLLDIT
jgi:hypothetical protein